MNSSVDTYNPTNLKTSPVGVSFHFAFTGIDPRKGWRTPLDKNRYSEQRDEETGYGFFGARYMDHELMTMWLSVDPMADKYLSISPYAYCAWNPVKLVDLSGMEANPIYDFDGNFLGTDDLGLQGEAIIMNKSDFRQNMSHDEAMEKGYTLDNMDFKQALEFSNNGNFNNFLDHYNSLCNRPDWDGYLTLDEANDWYRNGNGQTLFTDLRKIDLSGFRSLGESKVGKEYQYNLLVTSGSKDDRLVYGTVTFVRKSNDGVRAYADEYDFRMQPWWNPLNWGRNIETLIGRQVAGQGKSYLIYFYGTATLKRSIFAH